jgi:IrrE N-terminal-like domain
LRRGFKTQAEKRSADARQTLQIGLDAPLDPWAYAKHLGVIVLDFAALGLCAKSVQQLTVNDSDSWSAMTINEDGKLGIVLNPAHALTRQRCDLMHELGHVDLRHPPGRIEVSRNNLLLLSDYSEEHEEEADWYAGAMLLPRTGLIRFRLRQKGAAEIATYYGVSEALCNWRLRMTGVEIQLRRAR